MHLCHALPDDIICLRCFIFCGHCVSYIHVSIMITNKQENNTSCFRSHSATAWFVHLKTKSQDSSSEILQDHNSGWYSLWLNDLKKRGEINKKKPIGLLGNQSSNLAAFIQCRKKSCWFKVDNFLHQWQRTPTITQT